MDSDKQVSPDPQYSEQIFRNHIQNSIACVHLLSQLFLSLDDPATLVGQIKAVEEIGDRLTSEAYDALELLPDSDIIQLAEQFVRRLDDIVDGMNVTARMIDVFRPPALENAASQLAAMILAMLSRLQCEVEQYPDNDLSSVKQCRGDLKRWEEEADTVYHEWRKLHRRRGRLSLREETDWTELLGTLEQTTDDCYHAGLLLERIVKYHHRHQ